MRCLRRAAIRPTFSSRRAFFESPVVMSSVLVTNEGSPPAPGGDPSKSTFRSNTNYGATVVWKLTPGGGGPKTNDRPLTL
jgi:hypothetical protein